MRGRQGEAGPPGLPGTLAPEVMKLIENMDLAETPAYLYYIFYKTSHKNYEYMNHKSYKTVAFKKVRETYNLDAFEPFDDQPTNGTAAHRNLMHFQNILGKIANPWSVIKKITTTPINVSALCLSNDIRKDRYFW